MMLQTIKDSLNRKKINKLAKFYINFQKKTLIFGGICPSCSFKSSPECADQGCWCHECKESQIVHNYEDPYFL
jgi:hypothetical protein